MRSSFEIPSPLTRAGVPYPLKCIMCRKVVGFTIRSEEEVKVFVKTCSHGPTNWEIVLKR